MYPSSVAVNNTFITRSCFLRIVLKYSHGIAIARSIMESLADASLNHKFKISKQRSPSILENEVMVTLKGRILSLTFVIWKESSSTLYTFWARQWYKQKSLTGKLWCPPFWAKGAMYRRTEVESAHIPSTVAWCVGYLSRFSYMIEISQAYNH